MKGHKCNAEICTFIYCGDKRSSTSLQVAEKTQRKDTYVQNLDTYLVINDLNDMSWCSLVSCFNRHCQCSSSNDRDTLFL